MARHAVSGAPQGGVAFPAPVHHLPRPLDVFVETSADPRDTRADGAGAQPGVPEAGQRRSSAARKHGDRAAVRERAAAAIAAQPWIRTIRATGGCSTAAYADDHLLGFTGPKAEAEQIKQPWPRSCRRTQLELSPDKTLITHGRTGAARFLGYEITIRRRHTPGNERPPVTAVSSTCGVPRSVIKTKCAPHLQRGEPALPRLVSESDHAIVATFGAEYRGMSQYYLLACDVYHLDRLHWVMQTSLLKTLAGSTARRRPKMAASTRRPSTPRSGRAVPGSQDPRDRARSHCRTVRRHPVAAERNAIVTRPRPPNRGLRQPPPRHVPARPLRSRCEICGQNGQVEVHHIRKLADLDRQHNSQSRPGSRG